MNKQENYRMEEKDAIGIIAYIISIINKEMLDTYGSLLQMNVFFKKENGKMLVLINDKIAFQRNKEEKIKEVVEQLFYKYYNNVEAWLKNKEWDDFLDPEFRMLKSCLLQRRQMKHMLCSVWNWWLMSLHFS